MGQNSRQPFRVAARIGAGRVARLDNSLDIACIERLAITNSGSNAHVFHYVRRSKSTAADGNDDFELVAVSQHLFTMTAARHDLAVALERHALAGPLELLEQLPAVERLFKTASFTVDGKCNQDGNFGGRL